MRNHAPPAVDFATVHIWPEHWYMGLSASVDWIRHHSLDGDLLGKPVVFEDLGKSRPTATRDAWLQAWYGEIWTRAAAGGAAAGSCV